MVMFYIGVSFALKTDNGPAFSATAFEAFSIEWSINHKTDIPYNPQGQVIIERTNSTLKKQLDKSGDIRGTKPQERQIVVLLTIFF
jgi:transposase InsO family protein